MLELSITNYQMRRPPMATNVHALSDMTATLTIHDSQNDFVKKMIETAYSLQKQNQVIIEKDPSGVSYNVTRNFMDSVGTLYLRENRKLHFEIDTAYTEEIEIKAFFSKKVEKRHHVACITAVVPFTFDVLLEVRIGGNRITFTYSTTPDGKGAPVQFAFEMADVRTFARDLYEWAERKNFKLIKAYDEDFKQKPVDTQPNIEKPAEGTLYSVLIEPDKQFVEYGKNLQLTVKPIDVAGNIVPVESLKWSVDPPSMGSITQNGLFTPITNNGKLTVMVSATSRQNTTTGFATINLIPKQNYQPSPQYTPPPPPMTQQPAPKPSYTPPPPSVQAAPPPPPPPQPNSGKTCPTCHVPLGFSEKYKRFFCPKCQKWV